MSNLIALFQAARKRYRSCERLQGGDVLTRSPDHITPRMTGRNAEKFRRSARLINMSSANGWKRESRFGGESPANAPILPGALARAATRSSLADSLLPCRVHAAGATSPHRLSQPRHRHYGLFANAQRHTTSSSPEHFSMRSRSSRTQMSSEAPTTAATITAPPLLADSAAHR